MSSKLLSQVSESAQASMREISLRTPTLEWNMAGLSVSNEPVINMEPTEPVIKQRNKKDEIKEEWQDIQWSDSVSPNLGDYLDLIPRQAVMVDKLVQPRSSGSRVLIAPENGLLKIKKVAEDKAVLVKSLSMEMFSENSYIDKRRMEPEAQESHAYPFHGKYAIILENKTIHDVGSLPAEVSKLVQGVQVAKLQLIVECKISCHKLGLYNSFKAPEKHLRLGDICAKTAHSILVHEITDFFSRLLQKMAPKSYRQTLGKVVVTQKNSENFYGEPVCFLAGSFGVPEMPMVCLIVLDGGVEWGYWFQMTTVGKEIRAKDEGGCKPGCPKGKEDIAEFPSGSCISIVGTAADALIAWSEATETQGLELYPEAKAINKWKGEKWMIGEDVGNIEVEPYLLERIVKYQCAEYLCAAFPLLSNTSVYIWQHRASESRLVVGFVSYQISLGLRAMKSMAPQSVRYWERRGARKKKKQKILAVSYRPP
ncbi:unnamed protein product [Cuscuta epithymum]|uniref:Uncharacterized protein n=1 Tax=Cuscuta epithymum TaxID=186058 RepID=A0AAV0G399_9ASTE|nr:unnamed protein product [Cuscuta epithymum]CAH9142008.1 unnamed protein product [Cuscuta epithymum]